MSFVKLRKGESRQMNYWLRARVIAQGATVVAIVGYAYALGNTKQQKEARAVVEQEAVLAAAAKDRAEFEERLRGAEEAHREEEEMKARAAGARWFGMLGGTGKGADAGAASEPLRPPPGVSSAPAGVEMVHSPDIQSGASSAPAGAGMVRSPVADAPAPHSSKGLWSWLGFGSSEKKP